MNIKALVADDSSFTRQILTCLLNSIGVQDVVQARDGDEALRLFGGQAFDLVLTDWNMPGKTGLEVIQAIRATGSSVPIVMVTAERDGGNELTAIQAGASHYLTKPLRADLLRAKLVSHLSAATIIPPCSFL